MKKIKEYGSLRITNITKIRMLLLYYYVNNHIQDLAFNFFPIRFIPIQEHN